MTEQTWSDFREASFGDPYMVWHDGPDFQALRDSWRDDPARIEPMLLLGLGHDDELAPQAIGEIADLAGDSAPRLITALREALPGSGGARRVRIAEALRAFTGSDEWDRFVGDALDQPNFWSEHITAAMALRRAKPTPELIAVLERGVQNEESLVRHHSANTLLAWATPPEGDAPEIHQRDELFGDLIAEGAPKRWARVAAVLGDEARSALRR
jgi:hypothetical protein